MPYARTLLEEILKGDEISPIEIRILLLAANGQSSLKSTAHVRLSHESVKSYRKRIVAKLGANNMTHAVAIALSTGLLNPDDIQIPGE